MSTIDDKCVRFAEDYRRRFLRGTGEADNGGKLPNASWFGRATSDAKVASALFVCSHPLQILNLAYRILRLPRVTVHLTGDYRSDRIRLFGPRRRYKVRGIALSCLVLPLTFDDYLRGGKRQNLRTRASGARRDGLEVHRVMGAEILSLVEKVWSDLGRPGVTRAQLESYLSASLEDPNILCVGVIHPVCGAVAFSLGIRVGDALRNVRASTSVRGNARWLCFYGLVDQSYSLGLRYVIEQSIFGMTEGNREFSKDLGFYPSNIRTKRLP